MKKWWGIRHVRWFILNYKANRWAQHWAQHGIGLGVVNQADIDVLDQIWKGEC